MSHVLPDGWRWAKIGEIAKARSGVGFPIESQGETSGEYPFVKVSDISFSVQERFGMLSSAANWVTKDVARKLGAAVFPAGTTLFAKIGEAVKLNRRAITLVPVVADNNVMALVPIDGAIDTYYLFALTQNLDLTELTQPGTVPSIRPSEVESLIVSLPPLDEQQRIAAVLRAADESIASVDDVIRAAQEVKRGVMRRVFTYGMGGEGTPTQHTAIGEIPVGWKVVLLNTVCERVTDGTHAGFETLPEGVKGIPFLYVSCVRDGKVFWENAGNISSETYAEISKGREPRKNLILYTTVGSYGHAALIEDDRQFSFQRHIGYVMPDTRVVYPAYLSYWLNSSICRRYADTVVVGNAQKTVNLAVLAAYPVPLPPWDEQQEIATLLQSHDEAIRAMQVEADRLREVKRGLMQGLLSGTLRAFP